MTNGVIYFYSSRKSLRDTTPSSCLVMRTRLYAYVIISELVHSVRDIHFPCSRYAYNYVWLLVIILYPYDPCDVHYLYIYIYIYIYLYIFI